jgi:ABC-type oligopeptide transport system substrate-binding subunit
MTETTLVARKRELSRLDGFLNRALSGNGQVCFVIGEAGSGKTALITESAHQAQEKHDKLLVAMGTCNAQTGLGDPYLPLRAVLGMLTGDVSDDSSPHAGARSNTGRLRSFFQFSGQALVEIGPDLIGVFVPGAGLAARAGTFLAGKVGWLEKLEKLVERKAPAPGELEQNRIFEQYTGVLRAMAAKQPLVIVLDDLQWADAASLNLLFHLGRELRESRILLIGAYRPHEVALGRDGERHPLDKVLTEFKRYYGDVCIDLDQAMRVGGREFVDAFLNTQPNRLGEGFRQRLFLHTEGHPLFTVELLRDMRERRDLERDEQGCWVEGPSLDWDTLPPRVEGVVEERIRRLDDELRDILSVASVEGETFTAQVIAQVEAIQERLLLRKLSRELEGYHHLVEECGEIQIAHNFLSRYRFVHALFQHYLYSELSAGERRLLHKAIAEVLEELYQGGTENVTVQLARHYTEAGVEEKAIAYLLMAGDRARALYAYGEAIDHYQLALPFLRKGRDYEETARTLMKLGLTYHIAFDFPNARQAFEEGFALWQRAAGTEPAVDHLAPHPLRVDFPYPPLTLDPALVGDLDTLTVVDQLFSGLLSLSPEMDVVPDGARSWEVSEGGRRYVFRLRDDVSWSDGTPVTAGDYEYAWKRVLDPAVESPAASLLYDIKGAKAFHQGETSDPDGVGVQAVDELTLVVELEGPTSYLPHLLAYYAAYPVPHHVVESYGEKWAQGEHIVTNGPFLLGAWDQDRSMVLSRNPGYHGRFTGNVEEVELSFLAEWLPRLELYEADQLDTLALWDLSEARDRARQRHADEYLSGPHMSTLSVGFNTRLQPFDDPRVRSAFVQAADRETLADVVRHGYEFPATGGFLPPGTPGYSAGIGLPYNPEGARRLLAQAGYPGGEGFPPVTLLADQGRESLSDYLQAQWRKNLGVEVMAETVTWDAFMAQMDKEPPHLFFCSWVADYPDPHSFLEMCVCIKWTGWQDRAYGRLVERARRVMDQRERVELYRQADRLLVEKAVIMPFTYGRIHLMIKPWVTRFPTSATRWWYWKDVVIDPH